MSGDGTSSSSLRAADAYKYNQRKMITPTYPEEGDYISVQGEELIFGAIFACVAWWMFKQLRSMLRAPRNVKRMAGVDDGGPVGVMIMSDDDDDGTDASEDGMDPGRPLKKRE